MSDTIHLYVNMSGNTIPGTSFATIGEALASLPDVPASESGKQFPASVSELPPVILHIGKGIYREKLVITRPNITFEGTGGDETILVYGDAAFDLMPEGDKRGTFRTASVRIDTHDFTARNLTFQNDSGYGHTVGQALAVYVDGDRNAFYNCRFLGSRIVSMPRKRNRRIQVGQPRP
ncbi:MAG: pectinesterase family protein [Roseburia hominis]